MRSSILLLAVLLAGLLPSTAQARIEAVKGKQYELTKKHGPWMIVVASLSDRADENATDGKSADEAADELVYELRTRKIPAYKFRMDESVIPMGSGESLGKIVAGGQVSVIAGNYGAIDSEAAVKSLAWIKAYFPKCLAEGGVWKETPGRPGPLSGAFLTVNPLLTSAEVTEMAKRTPSGRREAIKRQRLLRELNSGNPYPLFKNPAPYSLTVAKFGGKSVTGNESVGAFKAFKATDTLDKSGREAWELCTVLRSEGVDAYLWHDRYESIVTVGSLSSKTDGRIRQLRQQYGVTYAVDPQTGQQKPDYKVKQVSGFGKGKNETRIWTYLPEPEVVAVPAKP